jgi:hypothetical protein
MCIAGGLETLHLTVRRAQPEMWECRASEEPETELRGRPDVPEVDDEACLVE